MVAMTLLSHGMTVSVIMLRLDSAVFFGDLKSEYLGKFASAFKRTF